VFEIGAEPSTITKARQWLASRIAPRPAPAAPAKLAGVGGGTPGSGVGINSLGDLNAMGALQSAAVWACCRLISQSIASLPGHIFEETQNGKQKAYAHPYYRMLTRQPNALMTYMQWLQTTVLHLLLWGNAFSLPGKVEGEVVELWPLDPSRVRILWNLDGSFWYRVFSLRGVATDYSPLDLLHFRIMSLDGVIGLAPMDFHRMTFTFEQLSGAYASSLYANGGRPSGVLEYPGTLRDDQITAIRNSWASIHGGPDAGGRVAVLEGGTKYTPISVPLQQLEWVATQKFSVEQIARIFGVPPHLIGAQDKTPYASVEQQSLEFSEYTLQPVVTGIEQTIETELLSPPFIYRLNLSAFARADINARYTAYGQGRQWGWFSVNDIRELEDLNRIGPAGDVYLQPVNMVAAGSDASNVVGPFPAPEDGAPAPAPGATPVVPVMPIAIPDPTTGATP
jgi:HK97 family phage portal protein